MSDTTTDPQGGAAAAAEPAVTEIEAPAPGTEGAATETETPEPEKPSRVERRIAALSARLSAGEQERARLAAENEAYRRQANPQPERAITPDDIPRIVEERVAAQLAQRQTQERVDRFHEAGRAAFPDWQDRCQSLMQMGADSQMAELLVDLGPDGSRVAAALSDDPEALEAITGLRSERAKAIALGKFSASLADRAPPVARNVSRAPAPIRPIAAGSARAAVDESRMTSQQLVDLYSKQAAAKR